MVGLIQKKYFFFPKRWVSFIHRISDANCILGMKQKMECYNTNQGGRKGLFFEAFYCARLGITARLCSRGSRDAIRLVSFKVRKSLQKTEVVKNKPVFAISCSNLAYCIVLSQGPEYFNYWPQSYRVTPSQSHRHPRPLLLKFFGS